jgi:hypothetical protein
LNKLSRLSEQLRIPYSELLPLFHQRAMADVMHWQLEMLVAHAAGGGQGWPPALVQQPVQQQHQQQEAQLSQLQQQMEALCSQLQRSLLVPEVSQPAALQGDDTAALVHSSSNTSCSTNSAAAACSSGGSSDEAGCSGDLAPAVDSRGNSDSSSSCREGGGTVVRSDQRKSPGSNSSGSARSGSGASASLEWQQSVDFVGLALVADLDLAQQPEQQIAGSSKLPWSKAVGGPGPPS